MRPDEYFNWEVGTDKDYLASSIAYRFDLHGTAEAGPCFMKSRLHQHEISTSPQRPNEACLKPTGGANRVQFSTRGHFARRLDLGGSVACASVPTVVTVTRGEVQLLKDYALCGGASFSPDAPIAAVDGLIWAPDGAA
ncbi:unnamed protein product [Durusdinium trenchii]|uniref:Uncharacterized protein n=1 Tax=Durusdinium trenchii TaxID=1381693 RepID=A0ABP0R6R7_9DINO